MIDKERLEEIKSRVWKDEATYVDGDNKSREGHTYTLSDYDYEWLIKQAERVQELEQVIGDLDENVAAFETLWLEEKRKNQRYKQALEFYADEENYCVRFEDDYEPILQDNGKTARQALESDEN